MPAPTAVAATVTFGVAPLLFLQLVREAAARHGVEDVVQGHAAQASVIVEVRTGPPVTVALPLEALEAIRSLKEKTIILLKDFLIAMVAAMLSGDLARASTTKDPVFGLEIPAFALYAATANLFAMHNRVHDFSFHLGFDEERWNALYTIARPGFALLSGDDPTFVRAMAGGGAGVISVASNVVPRAFARMAAWVGKGDLQRARALDARLQPLYDFLGVEPNPIPVKALLARMGLGQGLRLPLLPLSAAHAAEAERMHALCLGIESDLQ